MFIAKMLLWFLQNRIPRHLSVIWTLRTWSLRLVWITQQDNGPSNESSHPYICVIACSKECQECHMWSRGFPANLVTAEWTQVEAMDIGGAVKIPGPTRNFRCWSQRESRGLHAPMRTSHPRIIFLLLLILRHTLNCSKGHDRLTILDHFNCMFSIKPVTLLGRPSLKRFHLAKLGTLYHCTTIPAFLSSQPWQLCCLWFYSRNLICGITVYPFGRGSF